MVTSTSKSLPVIPLFKVRGNPDIGTAVQACFDQGYVSEGPKSEEFENRVADLLEAPRDRVVLTNSCTSALHLAYDLVGVRPGTNVVATPVTCLAGLLPVIHLGAKILWADIDPETGNLLYRAARTTRDHNTKAVYGVLWGGDPLAVSEIAGLGLPVIQDAAHGLGARLPSGAPVHSVPGTWTCYSFQAIKTMTCGDGGVLVCPDANMADCARKMRWFGLDRKVQGVSRWCQDIGFPGYKFHMNDVSAVIGLTQLPYVADTLAKGEANAALLSRLVADAGLGSVAQVARGRFGSGPGWLFTVLCARRDALRDHLASRGIASDVVHVRCDGYSLFDDRDLASQRDYLPGVDKFDREHLCIPSGWWVTKSDIEDRILPALVEFDRDVVPRLDREDEDAKYRAARGCTVVTRPTP